MNVATSNTWNIEVDRIEADDWDRSLDRFRDSSLYQTWAYGETRWGHGQMSHLVLKRNGEIAALAQLRIMRWPLGSGGIAYLRWGPLWRVFGDTPDPGVFKSAIQALHMEYVVRRRMCLRLIPKVFEEEPWAGVARTCLATEGFQQAAHRVPYTTFMLNLTPSLEELRRGLDKHWRKRLRQMEGKGLEIDIGEEDERLGILCELHREMSRRKGFVAGIVVEDFRRIQSALPVGHKLQILVAKHEGMPVSSAAFSMLGDTGLCLIAATNIQGRDLLASYGIKWKTIEIMKSKGLSAMDLGGRGLDRTPTVDQFKAGVGGNLANHIGIYDAAPNGLMKIMISSIESLRQVLHRR